MKTWDLNKIIHKKMSAKDKLYGTTTIGAKGQVVIPAQARKELGLKPGDQMLVMGKFGTVLGLVKAEAIEEFMEVVMKNLSGTGMETFAKEQFEKTFGKITKK